MGVNRRHCRCRRTPSSSSTAVAPRRSTRCAARRAGSPFGLAAVLANEEEEEKEEEEGGGDYRVIRNDKDGQGRDAMSMSRLPPASHVLRALCLACPATAARQGARHPSPGRLACPTRGY